MLWGELDYLLAVYLLVASIKNDYLKVLDNWVETGFVNNDARLKLLHGIPYDKDVRDYKYFEREFLTSE